MPTSTNQSEPGSAAATVLNFLSLLLFWSRHLPSRLPAPTDSTDGIYNHFYQVMQRVRFLGDRFPQTLPQSTGISTIRVLDNTTPEASGVIPPPLPNPRPPRVLRTPPPVPTRPRLAVIPEEPETSPSPQPPVTALPTGDKAKPAKAVTFDTKANRVSYFY